MTWKSFFTASIGKKFIMGLTGLFLIAFLIVHVGVNSCVFVNDQGETFNTAAHFMSHNWVMRIVEIGLFAGLLMHILQGLMLWKQNSAARPVKYNKNDAGSNSKWYSRSMGMLGTLLLLFLVIHISKFFVNTKIALYANGGANDAGYNLFEEMKEEFAILWVVIVYIIGVISLGWHLLHGFQSAFQTFGINHKRYSPIINILGVGFSIIITILFALMPLAFYLNWIG